MSGSRDESREPSVRDLLEAAARRAGIGRLAPGETPTGRALFGAIGGVRGLVEALLPGLAFLVLYTTTQQLVLSVLAPVVVSVAFVVVRLLQRTPPTQAFAGVIGVAISAVLALVSGRAEDSFVPGLIINAVSVLVLLVSIAVRYPLIGVIVGLVSGEGLAWRADRAKRRVFLLTTVLWVGLFAARLAVQVPLYSAGATAWLAGAKLIMGLPLYAAMLWVTWTLVRAVYARSSTPREE